MPELPEVETIRVFLTKKLPGKTITSLKVLSQKSFSGDPKKLIGQKITRLTRVGKQLSIHLSNNLILLIHLKMTGQLLFCHSGLDPEPIPKHTRLVFTLADTSLRGGSSTKQSLQYLYFNDLRKFGWIHLLTPREVASHQSTLGVDILSKKFTQNYFKSVLANSKKPIKTLLHDQTFFAGIGNIYANDALFLAKIHPQIPANKIPTLKIPKLFQSIKKVIKEGIIHGGSTARDKGYLRPDGSEGKHQDYFYIYQRQNQPCPICGTKIVRLKLSGRSAFLCPQCQKSS